MTSDVGQLLTLSAYYLVLTLLALYGAHRGWMVLLYYRHRDLSPRPTGELAPLPRVTVQLPIYNEVYVVERLVELQRHLDHLRDLRPRVTDARVLRDDLSLHNDVLFSLLTVCQLVIDIAAELSARRGLRFDDYTGAVGNLSAFAEVPPEVVRELLPLPGFRNVLIHEYVALDLERAVEALGRLDAIARFAAAVRSIEAGGDA